MSRPALSRSVRLQAYICPRCEARQIQLVAKRPLSTLLPASRAASKKRPPPPVASNRPLREGQSVLGLLEERGYVKEIAGDRNALDRLLATRKVGFYSGIDPTAPSLHLGHLLPLMVLFWLYVHGHHVVSLVGGATARVGDPSGRLTSREHKDASVQQHNLWSMHSQLKRMWSNAERYGHKHGYTEAPDWKRELLNNATWLNKLSITDFLGMMGTGMRIGTMLGRDTVKNKLDKGDGMSFAEFTYPLLQGWDWWHMFQKKGIQVQIGGSDQYGNIVAGMDAVKYIAQNYTGIETRKDWIGKNGKFKETHAPMGLTVPLLTTASGEKFGKSAGNAIWLDKNLTSTFDLYGFLLRASDDDVERYLKLFTFISLAGINEVMTAHKSKPSERRAQHLLAKEVLELVYGEEEATKTEAEHRSSRKPTLAALGQSSANIPSQTSSAQHGNREDSLNSGANASARPILPMSLVRGAHFSRILYHAGIVPSRSEGTRMAANGGLYVGVKPDGDLEADDLNFVQVKANDLERQYACFHNGLLVLRIGKWKVRVIEVIRDDDFERRGLDASGWTEFKAARPDIAGTPKVSLGLSDDAPKPDLPKRHYDPSQTRQEQLDRKTGAFAARTQRTEEIKRQQYRRKVLKEAANLGAGNPNITTADYSKPSRWPDE